MAYTILVNDDDTLYGSHKERIMQRQKLVNDLVFIVNPIYRNTAAYGHMGRTDIELSWEKTDKADDLKAALCK